MQNYTMYTVVNLKKVNAKEKELQKNRNVSFKKWRIVHISSNLPITPEMETLREDIVAWKSSNE